MKNPHILLISLETIRRDHLRYHGYHKDLAPHLDQLAQNGITCTDAIANCGWTLPQNITLHTGLYPLTHDLTLMREQHPIWDEHTTLAEHLKSRGYQTFAGVNNRNPYSAHAKYDFDRGFDEHNPGAEYNQHMDWTEEFILSRFRDQHASGPCFLYAHINDTHEPWDAPEPWRNMWGESYHNLYEGDITYTDHYLGRIFSGLRQLGIFDETLIVVFGDHGTELWEHGFTEKKVNLYNEILHVPLIFHCPTRLPSGLALPGLAESAQVAPTIVDIAGLPPLPSAQGKSLLPLMRGKVDKVKEFAITGYFNLSWSIVAEDWTYIHWLDDKEDHDELKKAATVGLQNMVEDENIWTCAPGEKAETPFKDELYDRKNDPYQLNNLVDSQPEVAREMLQRLMDYMIELKAEG